MYLISIFLIFSGANRSDNKKLILKKETQGVPQMKEKAVTFDADKLNHPSKAKEELADIDMDPDAIVDDEDELGMIVNLNLFYIEFLHNFNFNKLSEKNILQISVLYGLISRFYFILSGSDEKGTDT